jgi:hypothetical protein
VSLIHAQRTTRALIALCRSVPTTKQKALPKMSIIVHWEFPSLVFKMLVRKFPKEFATPSHPCVIFQPDSSLPL